MVGDYLTRFHHEAVERDTYWMMACVAVFYVGLLLIWWGEP